MRRRETSNSLAKLCKYCVFRGCGSPTWADPDICNDHRQEMQIPERRQFLSGLVASAMLANVAPGPAGADELESSLLTGTLVAVIDTIVPRDRDPGAVDAGVPDRIAQLLANDADLRVLYREGLALVEVLARERGATAFAALDAGARERIIGSLAGRAGQRSTVGAMFYRQVRADVLNHYWASEVGQRAVGYDLPSGGYPPPRQP